MSAFGLEVDSTWTRLGRLKEAGLGLNVGLFSTDAAWTTWGTPPGEDIGEPQVLVEGAFHDDHPSKWVDELFTELRASLVVVPRGAEVFATGAAWMDTWRVGVVGVLRRMTPEGIGIVR